MGECLGFVFIVALVWFGFGLLFLFLAGFFGFVCLFYFVWLGVFFVNIIGKELRSSGVRHAEQPVLYYS